MIQIYLYLTVLVSCQLLLWTGGMCNSLWQIPLSLLGSWLSPSSSKLQWIYSPLIGLVNLGPLQDNHAYCPRWSSYFHTFPIQFNILVTSSKSTWDNFRVSLFRTMLNCRPLSVLFLIQVSYGFTLKPNFLIPSSKIL